MRKNRLRLTQQYKFFLERQFIKGAHYQLLFVAALIGLISVCGGVLVLPSGSPDDNLGESIWWAFLRLSDPGYLGDDEGVWRRFISTIITVLGYVVFLGSLVAIITTWLNRKIRNLEQGLTPVAANNHVVILGWTNRTINIAGELFQSVGRLRRFLRRHGTRNLKLIILANDVTPHRLQELKESRQIGSRANEIILRSGNAIDREHLRRVDSLNASAIIIPSQTYGLKELLTPDVETIKTLLSLEAESYKHPGSKLPLVVAEIQDENKLTAAYRAYSGPLEVIASDTIISRLIAQNVRHTGLSEVYNELLSRSINNNLFATEHSLAVGKSIAQLRKHFPSAILMGVVRPDDPKGFKPMLNLPGDYIVEQNDRLVLLARNSEDTELQDPKAPPSTETKEESQGNLPVEEQSGIIRVLILGWNHHVPALIHELGTYEDETYHVTIASLRPIDVRKDELALVGEASSRVKCEHEIADYVREAELRRIDPKAFDNIILVSTDRLAQEEEADARTIVGYILLDEILKEATTRPQVLLELSDPENESLLKRSKSEVIINSLILSHLLAQIALRRELNSIYTELFTVGGAEIIFRNLQEYGLEPESIPFHELEERAAQFNETALGIFTDNPSETKPTLLMNPNRNKKIQLTPDVRLVVLTTIY